MRLRDWIHPGWFALYDWWRARRDSEWLDDELRAAHQPTPYGLAQLHRGPAWPMSAPTPSSINWPAPLGAFVPVTERARKRRDEAMRKADQEIRAADDEAAFLAAAEQMRAAKTERLSYQGPKRLAPAGFAVGDAWDGAAGGVIVRIEYGSWMDHRYPGDTEMVRIWTRADPAA